jgi:hypothetical protein
MAQSIPTFLADEGPPPTSSIQSGKELRLGYVLRQESVYVTSILMDREANPGDPTIEFENYDEKTWESFRNEWKKEAEAIYPEEGDYIVYLVDDTGTPVTTGSLVEYVGGTSPNTPGAFPCTEYIWDLSGVAPGPDPLDPIDPSLATATIVYRDCYNVEHTISDTIDNIGLTTYLCIGQPPSIMRRGVLTEVGPCDLTYKQCTQYLWDLTGVPLLDIVTIDYIDCDQLPVSLTSTAAAAIKINCGERDSFTVTAGIIVLQQTCI